MPRKDETKASPKVVRSFVKRHMEGESVVALSREFKISRATGYNWIERNRAALIAADVASDAAPGDVDRRDKVALLAENHTLILENKRLRARLFEYLVKHGDL